MYIFSIWQCTSTGIPTFDSNENIFRNYVVIHYNTFQSVSKKFSQKNGIFKSQWNVIYQSQLTPMTVILGSILVISLLAYAKLVYAECIPIIPLSTIAIVGTPWLKDWKRKMKET